MAEAERRFSKARLETFSDGVITIMVLDLRAPPGLVAERAQRLKARRGD